MRTRGARRRSRDAAEGRERDTQAQAARDARVGTPGVVAASLVNELTQPLSANLASTESAAELHACAAPDPDEPRLVVDDIVASST